MGLNSKLLEAEKVYLHPKFKYTEPDVNSFDDLAIVKLKEKLQFNNKIKPICMGLDTSYPDSVIIQGFGYKDDKRTYSTRLLEAGLTVQTDTNCKKTYARTYTTEHLCAMNGTYGACSGDSGNYKLLNTFD